MADLDLRMGAGLRDVDVTITTPDDDQIGTWRRSSRVFVEALFSPSPGSFGRFLVGAKAIYERGGRGRGRGGSEDAFDADYLMFGMQAEFGYALTPTPFLRIELLPYLGHGFASVDIGDGQDDADSLEYGANLHAVLTSRDGFQIGAGAGWSGSHSEHGGADVDQRGPAAQVFVGYRL